MFDCPHCFRSVLTTNNVCPSCQKNVLEDTTHGLAKIQIGQHTDFEDRCCLCNVPTRKTKKIVDWSTSESYDDNKYGVLRIVFYIFATIFLPISVLMPREGGMTRNYSKLTYKVPVCANCKGRDINVIASFPELNQICIAVSREFAERHIADAGKQ